MVREGHTNSDQSFTFNFDVTKYLMLKNWKIDSNFVVFSQYSNVTEGSVHTFHTMKVIALSII